MSETKDKWLNNPTNVDPTRQSSPFPYFGGKGKVADLVWEALGNVKNYVEPFFGSGAVLLKRPHWKGETGPRLRETVNDKDGYVVNAWRGLAYRGRETVEYADHPVFEIDLHARHVKLVEASEHLLAGLGSDPEWCDPKLAGWWLAGFSAWIGRGFCSGVGPWGVKDGKFQKLGRGEGSVVRQIPYLTSAGTGQNGTRFNGYKFLMERMRWVRITCGDWTRIVKPSVTYKTTGKNGVTGVFLDPPYPPDDRAKLYRHDEDDTWHNTWEWALENGHRENMRICVAGYIPDDMCEEAMSLGWRIHQWKAHGGFGNQSEGENKNRSRERLAFSPHCIEVDKCQDESQSLL